MAVSLDCGTPDHALSPLDTVKKIITDDREHLLTNNDLAKYFKKYALDGDEEAMAACYDVAFYKNRFRLYRPSQAPVPVCDFTLDFLWVNLDPQDRDRDVAENIFGDGLNLFENAECIKDPRMCRQQDGADEGKFDDEGPVAAPVHDKVDWKKIEKTFTYKISKWADVNPSAHINLWYDSALVTQRAQQNTFAMMRAISQSRGVDIRLRDIRRIPFDSYSREIEYSLHPGTPVYFRVDLLKVLIADYMMSALDERARYCVVSDIDVEPMSAEQTFDRRTMEYLATYGYVFNGVGIVDDFENSFFIFDKEKEGLQRMHRQAMIEPIASLITDRRTDCGRLTPCSERILGAQAVFRGYEGFRCMQREYDLLFRPTGHEHPRKVVKCPTSQFLGGGCFSATDFQSETFRFIGNDDNVPYTKGGRNPDGHATEMQIPSLLHWKAEPLEMFPVDS